MGVRSRRRCRSAQDSGVDWALFPGNITDKRSKLIPEYEQRFYCDKCSKLIPEYEHLSF